MTFEEKNTWVYIGLAVVLPIAYFTVVMSQLTTTAASEIDYIVPMLTAIGLAIGIAIVSSIVVSIVSGTYLKDERDKQINRRGDAVGFGVLGTLAIIPLVLAMLEIEPFWIANSVYFAQVVAAIVASIVKLVAYRKGV